MLASTAIAIRVDFNTNTGPIRPPTSTPPPPPPQPPFREPAPVWEDQSNDIPNPNPFRYVPPPPSRPRYNNNNNYDIETNDITNDNDVKSSIKNNQQKGFFVDVPPKFYKSSAKQQYYQQQYLNDVFSKNYYNKANKFNIIAFKDKYRGLPYYVFYFARVPSQQ